MKHEQTQKMIRCKNDNCTLKMIQVNRNTSAVLEQLASFISNKELGPSGKPLLEPYVSVRAFLDANKIPKIEIG